MPSPFVSRWALDPAVTFLNHGSFGACLREVLDAQQRLRDEMEREPVRFLAREIEGRLDAVRAELAAFLRCDAEGIAFVSNATAGVNAVLQSLELRAGAELLTTDHAYNACRNALDFAARRAGGSVVPVKVPFPVEGPDRVVEAVLSAVTGKTRLALLDHVTSPTGIVLPIEQLVRELEARGVDTLVDGAHAPGMMDLDVRAVGAAYYTGNLHKWVSAPKGAAFLHVRADRRAGVRPSVMSHGANSPRTDRSRFLLEFDWTGTVDPTPILTVPATLRAMGALLPGGFAELRERNRALALEARRLLADALGVPMPAPDSMIGSLAALPLPPSTTGPPQPPLYLDPLQEALFDRFSIEVPIVPWASPGRLVRVSAQLYNDRADYQRLADALGELLPRTP
jgi:isopenicillin-N epimerase